MERRNSIPGLPLESPEDEQLPPLPESDIAIGIDLGTTMCCVMAVDKTGEPQIIRNKSQGDSVTTPSYVAYHEDGSITFGDIAKTQAYKYPETTIYDTKRMIGRPWEDPMLQHDINCWPFKVVNENGNPKVVAFGRSRFPHEISARLLTQFRIMAEQHFDLPPGSITKCVVTVPAYFTEPQRRATQESAQCAGFVEVLNIISEPCAAAIAYKRRVKGNRTVLIYDLGGGTFDVTIANVGENGIDVLGVDGDTHLGGQDVDNLLLEYCVKVFEDVENYDIMAAKNSEVKTVRDEALRALSRIKMQCERAKITLASSESTEVNVERIVGSKDLEVTITKRILNALCEPLIQTTVDIVDRAIREAKGKGVAGKEDIDDVILVGGSTALPLVRVMLAEYFGESRLCFSINPDEAVAFGAATQAYEINKSKNGIVPELIVQDVLPLSLGIKKKGNRFSIIIPKNTKLPCQGKEIYTTTKDDIVSFLVQIFQGEKRKAKKNKFLGDFLLEGFPARPKGEEKAEVTMIIDSKGILHVQAISLSTGNANAVTITANRIGMDLATKEELTRDLAPKPVPKPRIPRNLVKQQTQETS